MAARPRGFETVGDMLRSLAVVGACVAVVVLLTFRQDPPPPDIDPDPVLAAAAEVAPFDASVPPETPSGWRVTSARISPPGEDPFTWYVGYSTDAGRFVAVTETDGPRAEFLTKVGANGAEDGSTRLRGDDWERIARPDGLHRALVREGDDVLTVVTGTADYAVLEDFAAALRAR